MSDKPRSISSQAARRLAISAQLLNRTHLAEGKAGILSVFNRLGCVQIDPIRAVERTQYLVLWSRLGNFDQKALDALIYEERRLFEFWAHAASIVRTEDYPLFQIQMRSWNIQNAPWDRRVREWVEENDALREHIVTELSKNGPLSSRDFDDRSINSWESGGWSSGQSINIMLGHLWRQGTIMVSHRKGLIKYWDLSERCLPEWTPREKLEWPEVVYLTAQRSLRALGVAREKHIANHFTRNRYPDLTSTLAKLEEDGRIMRVSIMENGEAWPDDWYIHCRDLPLLEEIEQGLWETDTLLLSPFDNLICDRDRTEELFGFRFRIEIYVPKAKREYGYYVMPILQGDRLVGRIDPKMNRKAKRLEVNAVYCEPDYNLDSRRGGSVAEAINRLGTFLGATEIRYGEEVSQAWQPNFAGTTTLT